MQSITNTHEEYLAGMIWVIVMMAMIPFTLVVGKMNERIRRRVGVEIEAVRTEWFEGASHTSLKNWMNNQGIETKIQGEWISDRRERDYDYTTVKDDSSVGNSSYCVEIVSPVMYDGADGNMIERICASIKGLLKPNVSCGLHVHIGLENHYDDPSAWRMTRAEREGILARCYHAYSYFNPAIDTMVSPSRRTHAYNGDRWARMSSIDNLLPSEAMRRITTSEDYIPSPHDIKSVYSDLYYRINGDRYQAVNPTVINTLGTIEYRQHQGTTNATKINAWAEFCYRFTVRASTLASCTQLNDYDRQSLESLFNWMGYSAKDNLFNYFKGKTFNGESTTYDEPPKNAIDYQEHRSSSPLFPRRINLGSHAEFVITNGDIHCSNCGAMAGTAQLRYLRNGVGTWDAEEETIWNTTCNSCEEDEVNFYFGALALGMFSVLVNFSVLTVGAFLAVQCGIGAVHIAKSKKFNFKAGIRRLWIGLSNRGKMASGIAYRTGDNELMYSKAPRPSKSMVHLVKKIPNKSVWSMMHTRYATHGINDRTNAHPHFSPKHGNITLVHNGVVSNHDTYRDDPKNKDIKWASDCDSETVAQVLEDGGIPAIIESGIMGSMSLIWSDNREDNGNTLRCWTNGGNPLAMARLDSADGGIAVASTKAHLKESFGKRIVGMWDAKIGREYIIKGDGTTVKVDHKDSELTDGGRAWWSYRTGVDTPSNYKVITSSRKDSPLNSKDTCDIKVGGMDNKAYELAIDEAFVNMDAMGSFKPAHGYDGYCAITHSQIDVHTGLKTPLPQYMSETLYSVEFIEAILNRDYINNNIDDWSWASYYMD